jgi:hypothetical protein
MGLVSAHGTMSTERLRRRVAQEAARLIFTREETQYSRAKMKAARQFCSGVILPDDLPRDGEIRWCLRAMNSASTSEQEELLTAHSAEGGHNVDLLAAENLVDRFRVFELLLLPLEQVLQSPEDHPEGDALYHSLQVFELARQALPYDEEFLLAALLHDVGKAIDRRNHVAAGLQALEGAITPRTAWLIEHHVEALGMREGTLGVRLRRRLEDSESYDELLLLADCDRRGRTVGMRVPDVQEALEYLRDVSDACNDDAT